MTITMSTNILPSSVLLNNGPELAKEDLQEFVNLGLLTKINNHREHYAIQPCWLHDPASGVMEEINNNVLGRWDNKLNAYVVAVNNIKNFDNSAGMNEDHRWLHVDITATYYTYSPEEGQRLKGEIKKVGHRAAICIIFDVFTATVFAKDETELSTWNIGDELRFEICSFIHRRKSPIIRARSIPEVVSKKRKLPALEEEEAPVEDDSYNFENSLNESGDPDESRSSRKKKKKKIKIKQEVDDSMERNDLEECDLEDTVVLRQDHDFTAEPEDSQSHGRKKKKKKKSSHSD